MKSFPQSARVAVTGTVPTFLRPAQICSTAHGRTIACAPCSPRGICISQLVERLWFRVWLKDRQKDLLVFGVGYY